MTAKEIIIVAGNLALATVALVLFGMNRLSLEQLGLLLVAVGFPSAGQIAAEHMRRRKDGEGGGDGGGAAGILVLLGVGLVLSLGACALFRDPEIQAENAYRAQQLECVDAVPRPPSDAGEEALARALEMVDDCRRRVRERWGITETPRKDGGR